MNIFIIISNHFKVFFPNDQEFAWVAAKMWFNNADAAYHRSCLNFGKI